MLASWRETASSVWSAAFSLPFASSALADLTTLQDSRAWIMGCQCRLHHQGNHLPDWDQMDRSSPRLGPFGPQ